MNHIKLIVCTLALSMSFTMAPSSYGAYNTAGTDYSNYAANSWIESGPADDAVYMADFLACIINRTQASKYPNKTYSALIDQNKCKGKKGTPKYFTATITTSRVDNNSPYILDLFFDVKSNLQILGKATITTGPSASLPFGVMEFVWNVSGGSGKGQLNFNADGTMSYLDYDDYGDGNGYTLRYIKGSLAQDGSSGLLRSYDGYKSYRYNFNDSYVYYDSDGSEDVCQNRSNITLEPHGYKLFTEAGAAVSMTGPFSFTYTDSSSATKNGWVDKWGVWLEGGETGDNQPATIVRQSDNASYNICYDSSDTSNICGTAADDIFVHLTDTNGDAYQFQAPLQFTSTTFVDTLTSTSVAKTLSYSGLGSGMGLDWQCKLDGTWTTNTGSNCNSASKWRPAYGIPDGTQVTISGGSTTYRVKAKDTKKTMSNETDKSVCSAILPLGSAPANPGYTVSDVTNLTSTWADLPAVIDANALLVVD